MASTSATPRPAIEKSKVIFADDYRELQSLISTLSGEPLPPCYFCSASQLWGCSQTGAECEIFKHYCA